jgi:ribosomal protein S30
MEAGRFSETLASTNQSTWRLNPKEHHHYFHRRENLKSYKLNTVKCTKMTARMLRRVVWKTLTVVPDVVTASVVRAISLWASHTAHS